MLAFVLVPAGGRADERRVFGRCSRIVSAIKDRIRGRVLWRDHTLAGRAVPAPAGAEAQVERVVALAREVARAGTPKALGQLLGGILEVPRAEVSLERMHAIVLGALYSARERPHGPRVDRFAEETLPAFLELWQYPGGRSPFVEGGHRTRQAEKLAAALQRDAPAEVAQALDRVAEGLDRRIHWMDDSVNLEMDALIEATRSWTEPAGAADASPRSTADAWRRRRSAHAPFFSELRSANPRASWLVGYLERQFDVVKKENGHPLHTSVLGGDSEETIGQHHRRAFEQWLSQRRFAGLRRYRTPEGVDLDATLGAAFLLHDIGKYRAKYGDHAEHSLALMLPALRALGFSPREIELATFLVAEDLIGRVARNEIGVAEAEQRFRRRARRAGFDPEALFALQLRFNGADGAAYPDLREYYFASKRPWWDALAGRLGLGQRGEPERYPTHAAVQRLAARFGIAPGRSRVRVHRGNAPRARKQARRLIAGLRAKLAELAPTTGLEDIDEIKALLAAAKDPLARRIIDSVIDEDAEVVIAVPSKHRGSVRRRGIANTHQTGSSQSGQVFEGLLARRKAIEGSYLGLTVDQLEGLEPEALPKYGVLAPKSSLSEVIRNKIRAGGDDHYIFALRDVADHLTVTLGDSGHRVSGEWREEIDRGTAHRPETWDQVFLPWSEGKYLVAAKFLLDRTFVREEEGLVHEYFASFEQAGGNERAVVKWEDPAVRRLVESFRFPGTVPFGTSFVETQYLGRLPLGKARAFHWTEVAPEGRFLRALKKKGVEVRPPDFYDQPTAPADP